jgi:hypothetical protein
MVEQSRTNTGQGLGIAGLVLGIISIPLAIMGCTFIIALLFGAVGIVLSAIGLSQAKQSNGPKGITTAGLVVSIIGSVIAILWFLFLGATFNGALREGRWFDKLEKLEEVSKEIEKDIEEDIEDDIDEEKMDDKDMEDLEKKMEDLEGEMKKSEEEEKKKDKKPDKDE